MREQAANDFDTIRKHLRRNRVIELSTQAGLSQGAIPHDIMRAAGYSDEEIAAIPTVQRTLPLNATDLL